MDTDHPGYLIKTDWPMVLRVPYHVLPVFPESTDLRALWDISRQIRSSSDSVICISGSNAIRKLFDIVNDIDYCEYLSLPNADALRRLSSNISIDGDLRCLRVSLGKEQWAHPWARGKPGVDYFEENARPDDKDRSSCKYDYVGRVERFGVIEITNVILLLDAEGNSASLKRTFAAQEAPLVAVDWIPNKLADPWELGRYVDWLIAAVSEEKSKGNFAKCLKRSASLSRVMFLPDITEAIADLADNSGVLIEQKLVTMTALRRSLEGMAGTTGEAFRLRLDDDIQVLDRRLKESGAATRTERLEFAKAAQSIADSLLSHFPPLRTLH